MSMGMALERTRSRYHPFMDVRSDSGKSVSGREMAVE
jgi:hypothetical protein